MYTQKLLVYAECELEIAWPLEKVEEQRDKL